MVQELSQQPEMQAMGWRVSKHQDMQAIGSMGELHKQWRRCPPNRSCALQAKRSRSVHGRTKFLGQEEGEEDRVKTRPREVGSN